MDKSWLTDLVIQLYAAVQAITGYPAPEILPEVRQLPRAEIEQMICTGPCQIRAFYHPEFGIVVDESFNLKSNLYHQSILLHELVHHAQHSSGRFYHLESACHARSASEGEAYEVQNRYLSQQRASERIPVLRWELLCGHEEGGPPVRRLEASSNRVTE
ncbi:MAG: hypothetical protein EXR36_10720 [Betaproteobacteria bacterium]|nr:hypothetical protein [Betaproteobacteria bacterium]